MAGLPTFKFNITRLDQAMAAAGFRSDNSLSLAAGMARDAVRDLRRARAANPGAANACALAHVLGVTVEWLMGGEGDQTRGPARPNPTLVTAAELRAVVREEIAVARASDLERQVARLERQVALLISQPELCGRQEPLRAQCADLQPAEQPPRPAGASSHAHEG